MSDWPPADAPPPVDAPPPTGELVRISVEQYDTMIEHGVLADNDRVELLGGWLVAKMAKTLRHTLGTEQVRETGGRVGMARADISFRKSK